MKNKPVITYSTTQCSYDPTEDKIRLPHIRDFDTEEEYYATLFHELIHSTGHPARLGTAKEFLETVCKSILNKHSIKADPEWQLTRLVRETKLFDFKSKFADDPDKAEASIRQILGGISAAIQGVTELRNAYGSGHGKNPEFKGLEPKFAKLIVGLTTEFVLFYLACEGENTQLI